MTILSIIIPVYKVEPYLRECLNSIATSTLDCWEAILIDDGSPDGCPQICDKYAAKDSRFRVIHQENAGVAAARNAGLDVARGEWIWFVDSDDVVDMRPVAGMVEWLKQNGSVNHNLNPNANKYRKVDLVMFDLETFDENGNGNILVKVMVNVNVERDVSVNKNDFLLRHVCFHHQRLWYKKEKLDQYTIRFTKGLRLAEDLELQYKYLTLCENPIMLNSVLYYYRMREGSATQDSTYRAKAVEDLQIVLDHLAEWIRKYNIKPEPWLDLRMMKLFQNLLYSASMMNNIDIQKRIREIIDDYRSLGFPFVSKLKYRLASWNIKLYNILNSLYLKLSCVK